MVTMCVFIEKQEKQKQMSPQLHAQTHPYPWVNLPLPMLALPPQPSSTSKFGEFISPAKVVCFKFHEFMFLLQMTLQMESTLQGKTASRGANSFLEDVTLLRRKAKKGK